MGHIELVGPPGAGKSSIHKRIVSDSNMFGGVDEDAITRVASDHTNKFTEWVLEFSNKFEVDNILTAYRKAILNEKYLSNFVLENKDFFGNILDVISNIEVEKEVAFRRCLAIATDYQIGMVATQNDETLCMDEGFSQLLAGILWRLEDNTSVCLRELFNAVPQPEAIIHVQSPNEICVERQLERGRVVVGDQEDDLVELQSVYSDICSEICNKSNQMGVNVVNINNNGDIEEASELAKEKIYNIN